jgi:basic membrane protein A and related proteins
MKHTKDLIPAAILEKVETAKQDILSGKIKVWNVVDQGYPEYLK